MQDYPNVSERMQAESSPTVRLRINEARHAQDTAENDAARAAVVRIAHLEAALDAWHKRGRSEVLRDSENDWHNEPMTDPPHGAPEIANVWDS